MIERADPKKKEKEEDIKQKRQSARQSARPHGERVEMETALIDGRLQASQTVKHLLQRREGGYRISDQSIQGHQRRG